jgi:hypothetical protein
MKRVDNIPVTAFRPIVGPRTGSTGVVGLF